MSVGTDEAGPVVGIVGQRTGRVAALRRVMGDALALQRGHLLPWAPVALGLGLGLYFALPVEPGRGAVFLLAGLSGLAALPMLAAGLYGWARPGPGAVAGGGPTTAAWRGIGALVVPLMGLALVLAGLALGALRTQLVAAPVLDFRYYGPVQGRVIAIDRSASEAPRLTLDRVVLQDMPPARTPERVRVSLHPGPGVPRGTDPEPGMVVMLTASLLPPQGPVSPRGYDFRRQAWFDRLGAVGFSRSPVMLLDRGPGGGALALARLRRHLSAALQARIAGQPGAFAATILTGDRSGLSPATRDDLRAANLSHLLSISGLHMVLVCGTVFAALRLALAAIPPLALRWPLRKLAASAALAAGLFYLLLSGRGVPAERAWVMVAVMLGAILVDRRALSPRSVALAALVVLLLRPESLVEPGFQMSFAATVALVSGFEAWRRLPRPPLAGNGWPRRIGRGLLTLALSSALAGLATAPFAAAHFNRMADYGLIANLATVPLMGLLIMPAGVAAAVLAPVGLAGPALAVMAWPIRWILAVAHEVAGWPGAVTAVVAPGPAVLPLVAGGGLLLCLWQGRGRWFGVLPLALAGVLWSQAERPVLLVSDDGGLLGVMTAQGRALSKPRGQGFAARVWLEDDGDPATQAMAATRPGIARGKGELRAQVGPIALAQFHGRGAAERAVAACPTADLVISTVDADSAGDRPQGGCLLLDPRRLARSGAVALWLSEAGTPGKVPLPQTRERGSMSLRLRSVADLSGIRPWAPRRGPPPDLAVVAGHGIGAEGGARMAGR